MTNATADPNPNYRFSRYNLGITIWGEDRSHEVMYDLQVRDPDNVWVSYRRYVEKDSQHDPKQIEKEMFDRFQSGYKRTLRHSLRSWWANCRLKNWLRERRR